MKIQLLYLIGLFACSTSAQISFDEKITLTDRSHYTADVMDLIVADLNNDGYSDLIVASAGDDMISYYLNHNGELNYNQRVIISQGVIYVPNTVKMGDVDGDGVDDVISCSRYNNAVYWCKNLGDGNFGPTLVLSNLTDAPTCLNYADLDNDGLKDIIVAKPFENGVSWLKNLGSGNFGPPITIYTANNTAPSTVEVFDMDNDGLPEIFSVHSNELFWSKNLGNGNFDPVQLLAYSLDTTDLIFMNIDEDELPDLVTVQYENYVWFKNNSITFDSPVDIAPGTARRMYVSDMDHDGKKDIVAATTNTVEWVRNLGNENFAEAVPLATGIDYPKALLVEDFTNDNLPDVVVPSYTGWESETTKRKLSFFKQGASVGTFTETVLNCYNGAVQRVKVADINNDGQNDIISGFTNITWNENRGDGTFTSQKYIGESISYFGITGDIEVVDMDNDSDLDIVCTNDNELRVYYNQGNETFELEYTSQIEWSSKSLEIADFNGDNFKDIMLTFTFGTTRLAWIPGINGTTFGAAIPLTFPVSGYEPAQIRTGDIDNDGDIDAVANSPEHSRIHWFKNDGAGNFTCLLAQTATTFTIELADFNNDDYLDIITADDYYEVLSYIENNGNDTFAPKVSIASQIADDLLAVDINNDGYIDIVGGSSISLSSGSQEKTFYLLNNSGNGFGSIVVFDEIDPESLVRGLASGDLNNDGKLDIATTRYFTGKIDYFLNTSLLTIEESEAGGTTILYPVPFTSELFVKVPSGSNLPTNIKIYQTDGKLVKSFENVGSHLDLSDLKPGIFIAKIKEGRKTYSKKIVKR